MKRLPLRQQLLLFTLLPSAMVAMALVAFFTYTGVQALDSELRAKGLAAVRYLAPVSEFSIIAGQNDHLYALAQASLQDSGVKAVIITNRRGRVLAVSGRVSLGNEHFRQLLTEPALVQETGHWLAWGAPVRRTAGGGDDLFEVPASRPPEAEIIGQVFIEYDKRPLEAAQDILIARGLLIVLAGLAILAVIAIVLADNLARPVMRLVDAVRRLSAGQFATRIDTDSGGEIGILEQGFNDMAENIHEAHRSMQARIEEATAQLAFQARHDALTGLFNRREFEIRLEMALAAAQNQSEAATLLFLDLDRFKPINDICGHLAGDELLRQLARLLEGRLREADTLARLGGDEFGILLPGCRGDDARQVAEDLCHLVQAYRFIWQDKVFSIGLSVGMTPIHPHSRSTAEILAGADGACQAAKESGRNCVCERQAEAPVERRNGHPAGWPERLTAALADNRLQMLAVPLLPLTGSRRHAVELTARLIEPGESSVFLPALMDAAERYGFSAVLDRRLIEAAANALARARGAGQPLTCLVPVSMTSLLTDEALCHLLAPFDLSPVDRQGLCLLVDESAATQHVLALQSAAGVLAQAGVELVLDDFSGSLASFSQLRTLSPAYVRLSRSLTRNIGGDAAASALLRAVHEVVAERGIGAIAVLPDGDEAPLDTLREFGIDYVQGTALGPLEPLEVWLEGAVLRGRA